MVSYGEVRRWAAAPLHQAVGRLNTMGTALEGLTSDVDDSGRTNRWHGQAARGAASALRKVRTGMADLVSEVAAMRTAMGEAADAVDGLGAAVTETESMAVAHDIRIENNGSLHDTVQHSFPSEDAKAAWESDHNRVKAELTDRVEQIIRRADDIDHDLSTVMERCLFVGGIGNRQHDLLTEAARAGAEAGHLSLIGPPADGTVAANAAWYDTLGEREKAWILANKPEMIGNLDGVPAGDRHDANVARVASERTRLQAEQDTYPADSQEFKQISDKLAALEAIDLTLKEHDDRQLLVLDMTGERAKAAIAIGNVDDADHVAVLTPGVNSTIENGGLEVLDDSMYELRDKTSDELDNAGRGGESVAVVTWLNYEPPLSNAGALFAGPAADGANRLAPFLEGLNASRSDDFHLTALGHSYGSLATGLALRDHPNTGVDDAVFFGSPGIGVGSASELNVPGGHSYNMAANEDAVAALSITGYYGEPPVSMDGMRQLSTDAYTTPDGQHLEEAHGHSEYLRAGDKDTTTEWNMANIIAGTGNVR